MNEPYYRLALSRDRPDFRNPFSSRDIQNDKVISDYQTRSRERWAIVSARYWNKIQSRPFCFNGIDLLIGNDTIKNKVTP